MQADSGSATVGERPGGWTVETTDDWNITDEQWKVFYKHKASELEIATERALEEYIGRDPDTEVPESKKDEIRKAVKTQMWNDYYEEVRLPSRCLYRS